MKKILFLLLTIILSIQYAHASDYTGTEGHLRYGRTTEGIRAASHEDLIKAMNIITALQFKLKKPRSEQTRYTDGKRSSSTDIAPTVSATARIIKFLKGKK